MLHKTTIYKRKLKGFSLTILVSCLIFLFVFGLLLTGWLLLRLRISLMSPLSTDANTKSSSRLISQIQSLCIQQNLSCHTIVIHTDETATMTIDTDEKVILSLKKDLGEQITSLQLTIQQLTINNKRFSRMDFRFDKPVVTY